MQATHAEHLKKRQLNQLSPISCLCPEIFSTIFYHVIDSITRPSSSMWTWGYTKDWIGITHVFHLWRDIAINTPTLWATIFISVEDHIELVQEMLRRSKQCSLSVLVSSPTLHPGFHAVAPICNELKKHMHRFRQLNFFSNSHAHQLEQLHIWPTIPADASDTSSDTFPDTSDARFTLNDHILRADSLRCLSFEHCGLDFHATFLRSLTHLELIEVDQDFRLPVIEFVAVLACISGLERLTLQGFLKDVERFEEYVARTKKTHLHIKYLSLWVYELGEMIQFLYTIILPPSCQLRLHISHEGPKIVPGLHLITSWLSKHLQHAPFFLSLQCFSSWSINDTFFVTINGFSDSTEDINKALLSVSVHGGAALINDYWRSFLKSLPLHNIDFLKTDNSATLPDSVWVEVFSPLTTLKTIIIQSDDYPSFFRIASPGPLNPITRPFPALSSVTVTVRCVEDYLSIANFLDSRLEAGLEPCNLVLYTNDIKPHAIDRLRKSALNLQICPTRFTSPPTL